MTDFINQNLRSIKNFALLILITSVAIGCSEQQNNDADSIVSTVIETAGGAKYENAEIEFKFRGREYGAMFQNGRYEFVRLFKDSTNVVRDVLNNDGFSREINGQKTAVIDTMAVKYARSVNSVIYFALLPYNLGDDAVNKKYLEEVEMNGKKYHKLQITFDQEGGGEDFEDVFIYWVNQENNKVDYLAYSYNVDGGGIRFREAYNERIVDGIRFVDYINYKPEEGVKVHDTGKEFMAGKLKELSKIELENIKVNRL